MHETEKIIYVFENWSSEIPRRMGILYMDFIRGQETFAFEYDMGWLRQADFRFSLDPDLMLYQGRQYAPLGKQMFGLFADSCPDRWGRLLMKRREAILAREEKRKPRSLSESDYLLGVHDEARMGALRFKLEPDGPFLSSDSMMATPPWVHLRKLESASLAFENDESGLERKWLEQLLAPGSSLGGARPKATVQAADGTLWIAKFPSKHDEYDAGTWEKVVHDLAGLSGLCIPESRLERFSKNGGTFLVKRFDRDRNRRIHFASAMTLLGRMDGASGAEGASYLELAEFLRSNGAAPQADLKELWRRIVFNMAVSNTDDHLRNHGFLLVRNGWRLSPLYDVNPIPYGDMLSLNVNEFDAGLSIELALEVAEYFGLPLEAARQTAADICTAVRKNWMRLAAEYGLSRGAVEYMRPAFQAAEWEVDH